MTRRALGLLALLLALLVASACAEHDAERPASRPTPTPSATPTPSPSPTAAAPFVCDGVAYDEVVGARPTYTSKPLARFANDQRICRATWLPEPREHLVPQGIALGARTAWVSGFRYRPGYGNRPCQLFEVDLRTGRMLRLVSEVTGGVGGRPPTFCRHGGGIVQQGQRLWIVEKNRLWLVDPSAAVGGRLRAERVWRLRGPVRGSAVVVSGSRIGLVPFQKGGRPVLAWYELADVQRAGVLELGLDDSGPTVLGAVARTEVPTDVQGATVDREGGLWLSRSNLVCGELVGPDGRRIALVPGAEGIAFDRNGDRLWVVSESGAPPYARGRKPLTAAFNAYEWPGLAAGSASTCRFEG